MSLPLSFCHLLLKFMKLLFKLFFLLFLLFLSSLSHAESNNIKYKIITSGITIGELNWDLSFTNDNYQLKIELNSSGLTSYLYNFNGFYLVSGKVINNDFVPSNYSQKWKTKNKKSNVEILFKDKKFLSLRQTPPEKEHARINLLELTGYTDPLTSFLKLLRNKTESKTIDGRRVYQVSLNEKSKDGIKKTYTIKNYKNIWADHKRNDLEKIIIFSLENSLFPEKIYIVFKSRLYKVIKI